MQKNHSAQLRALYIILVPIVVLIIILNSGVLQKVFPAARIRGAGYSVTRYNYYYYDYYNRFLEENEFRLDELGYDPGASAGAQPCSLENGDVTWKEYFQRGGEREMAETAYYCGLAAEAGYVFSEAELEPVSEKLAENAAFQTANHISAKNYYIAYYGSGVTEGLYIDELTRQVKARAYRTHLAETVPLAESGIAAYIADHAAEDYPTVDLRIITLEAAPDRETGLIGQEQEDALSQKMERLAARFEAGESFESLQAAFSTCAIGDKDGYIRGATRLDLPETLLNALLGGNDPAGHPDGFPVGGWITGRLSEGTAYFVILDGYGESGLRREAQLALGMEAVLTEEDAALASDYAVERVKPGILLATG